MYSRILIFTIALFLASFLGDRTLGLLGFPGEPGIAKIAGTPYESYSVKSHEFQYDYHSNKDGLRYGDIPYKKPADEKRVYVVGDSFTEGVGVQAEHTFSALLEQAFSSKHQPVRFINAGKGNRGPVAYGQSFQSLGLRYQPDALLYVFFANDISDTPATSTVGDMYFEKSYQKSVSRRLFYSGFPHIYSLISAFRHRRYVQEKAGQGWSYLDWVKSQADSAGISEQDFLAWKKRVPKRLITLADQRKD